MNTVFSELQVKNHICLFYLLILTIKKYQILVKENQIFKYRAHIQTEQKRVMRLGRISGTPVSL